MSQQQHEESGTFVQDAWSVSYYGTLEDVARNLFQVMHEHGVVRMQASYSGGNDEGGVQELEAVRDAYDKEVEVEGPHWDNPLVAALDAVLATKYGGWAFDGNSWGTIYADAMKRRVWTDGSETTEQEDPNPIDVQVPRRSKPVLKDDWKLEVANDQTTLSFEEWVQNRS